MPKLKPPLAFIAPPALLTLSAAAAVPVPLPVLWSLLLSFSAAACRFLFWVPKTGAISELAACSGPKKGASAAQKTRAMLVIIYKPSVTTPAHFHVAYSIYFLRLFAEASEYKPVFEIGIASAGVSSALAVKNTKTNSPSFRLLHFLHASPSLASLSLPSTTVTANGPWS